ELCYAWTQVGRLADALAVGERALAEQEALGNPRGVARALLDLGDVRRALDRPAEARDLYDRARAAHEKTGDRRSADIALCRGAYMRLGLLDLAGAEERFTRAVAEGEALGDSGLVAEAMLGLGRAVRDRGS